jgi:hypothetical protein
MASNSMTSALTQAPIGLAAEDTPPMEGGITIILEAEGDGDPTEPAKKGAFDENLAETMDESDLQSLSSDLLDLFDQDVGSRKDWADMYVKGMEVLGMKYEERTEPWAGACGVYSTILTEAAIRFQADTILETFPAKGPVLTEIIGAQTPEKEEAAERVAEDMNFQLTEEMPEFRPEHEKMLFSLGLGGAAFKKVYYDPAKKRQVSVFVQAEDVILPYGTSSAWAAERLTHIMRKTKNEVKRLQAAGFYRECDLGDPVLFQTDIEKKKAEEQGYTINDDDRFQILEFHVDYVLPGGDKKAGYTQDDVDDDAALAHPYIVTIERGTTKVLAVRRNWDEGDDTFAKRQHFAQYTYIPGFGAYGIGLIHLIGGYARAGTSIIRQLVDAGTLSNLPGGMKTRGLRTKGDDTPIAPGEFRDVDIPSGTLRDNIMPLPYKEPSAVLAGLLDKIVDEGRRLGSIADMKAADMSAQAPVGTTLALLERQLKTMTAVQARVHFSFKQELKLLKAIIRDYTPKQYSFDPVEGDRKAKQADYDMVDVIPVSDPNSATMAQRIMQYQAALQLAAGAPQIYNLPKLHRQMLEVLGIKNAAELVPTDDDQQPRDPVSENMSFLSGKPAKAFLSQDHDAHIAVHSCLMQDPIIMGQLGQNPMAQQIMASIQAHIAEHLGFQYRAQLQQQLGVTLPPPDAKMDENIEAQLSKLVAMAAVQLMQQHQGQAAQQQAQQQMQDPIIQMQMQELQIKKQDSDTKREKAQADIQAGKAKLMLEAHKLGMEAPQETPEMVAERHAQEMAAQQQQQEQLAQKHAQERAHAQQTHEQALAHGGQVHVQKLTQQGQQHNADMTHTHYTEAQKRAHAQQAHEAKLQQMKATAAAAAKAKPAPAKKGDK